MLDFLSNRFIRYSSAFIIILSLYGRNATAQNDPAGLLKPLDVVSNSKPVKTPLKKPAIKDSTQYKDSTLKKTKINRTPGHTIIRPAT
jgi:hypothetical protein